MLFKVTIQRRVKYCEDRKCVIPYNLQPLAFITVFTCDMFYELHPITLYIPDVAELTLTWNIVVDLWDGRSRGHTNKPVLEKHLLPC